MVILSQRKKFFSCTILLILFIKYYNSITYKKVREYYGMFKKNIFKF